MSRPVLIIGAGGHGRVCADVAITSGRQIVGFLDNNPALLGHKIDGVQVLGDDRCLTVHYPASTIILVNGIGSTTDLVRRRSIFERLAAMGYEFETLRHPYSSIAHSAVLGSGVQIMAGAVIQPGAFIGDNTIVNSGAVLEHDCVVGAHSHIAPGAIVCGGVTIGAECHIGAGATIIQSVAIGEAVFVAAGAVVIRAVGAGQRIAGVPAVPMERK